jgi:ABC-type nitrate/sulfonate/bicarbonate transport system permease component
MMDTSPALATEPTVGARLRAAIVYYLPSVLVMVALVVIWQLVVTGLGIKEYILPTPLQAVRTLFESNYKWTANLRFSAPSRFRRCWVCCLRS